MVSLDVLGGLQRSAFIDSMDGLASILGKLAPESNVHNLCYVCTKVVFDKQPELADILKLSILSRIFHGAVDIPLDKLPRLDGSSLLSSAKVHGLIIHKRAHAGRILDIAAADDADGLDLDGRGERDAHEELLVRVGHQHWEACVAALMPWTENPLQGVGLRFVETLESVRVDLLE